MRLQLPRQDRLMAGVWETAGPGGTDMLQNQDGEMETHGIVPIRGTWEAGEMAHGAWVAGGIAHGIWGPGEASLGKVVPGTAARGI